MAKRPKGSYTEFLTLSAKDIREMGEAKLRRITTKLNDAANKRMKRIINAGLGALSPAVRKRKEKIFKLPTLQTFESWQSSPKGGQKVVRKRGMTEEQYLKAQESAYVTYRFNTLTNSYALARNFLQADETGSIEGVLEYNERFSDVYSEILGFDLGDPQSFDRRYKRRKVLKKSVKDRLSEFWRKYDEWREIAEANNPNEVGDTNINSVEKFYQEVYSKGKLNYKDMEEIAKNQYLQQERQKQNESLEEESENEAQQPNVSTETPIRGRKKKTLTNKRSANREAEEWEPQIKPTKYNIF